MSAYVPDRCHAVWINFNPQLGHEQAGRRPGLVLSPLAYNKATSLAVVCPITSQIKNNPFEVIIPKGLLVQGAILADHVKNLDWTKRDVSLICKIPNQVVNEVLAKLWAILRP